MFFTVGLLVLVKSSTLARGLGGVQTEAVRNYELRQKRLKDQPIWKKFLSVFFYPVWPDTVGIRDNRAMIAGGGILIMVMGVVLILEGLGWFR